MALDSNYGVTPTGFVKKRLDTIKTEIQSSLSQGFGFDVAGDEQSFLNVLITVFSDRIAQLWEGMEQIYFSQYPTSAEGVNLDSAAFISGIFREKASPTVCRVLCTGEDNTVLPLNTTIRTKDGYTPSTEFTIVLEDKISLSRCNMAVIKPAEETYSTGDTVSVALNGKAYTYTVGAGDTTPSAVLTGLYGSFFSSPGVLLPELQDVFTVVQTAETSNIVITYLFPYNTKIELSSNLSADSVSTVITFQSKENGAFNIPNGTLSQIVTSVLGFTACNNCFGMDLGGLEETDAEFRRSYLKKLGARAGASVESISANIINNCKNADDVFIKEDTSEHKIMVVVDGGDSIDIAKEILRAKPAGIGLYLETVGGGTYPDAYTEQTNVTVGEQGKEYDIPITFGRPIPVTIKTSITYTCRTGKTEPAEFNSLAERIVREYFNKTQMGETINVGEIQYLMFANFDFLGGCEVAFTVGENTTSVKSYSLAGYEKAIAGDITITPSNNE